MDILWLMGIAIDDELKEFKAQVKSQDSRKVYEVPVSRAQAIKLAPLIGKDITVTLTVATVEGDDPT
jgi:hypothetical protein